VCEGAEVCGQQTELWGRAAQRSVDVTCSPLLIFRNALSKNFESKLRVCGFGKPSHQLLFKNWENVLLDNAFNFYCEN
jgi:hypothetical protein